MKLQLLLGWVQQRPEFQNNLYTCSENFIENLFNVFLGGNIILFLSFCFLKIGGISEGLVALPSCCTRALGPLLTCPVLSTAHLSFIFTNLQLEI